MGGLLERALIRERAHWRGGLLKRRLIREGGLLEREAY